MDKKQLRKPKFNISLSEKIISIIVVFFLLCAIMWISVMFINFTSNAKETALEDEKNHMEVVHNQIKNVEEICNLANQIITKSDNVSSYLIKAQKNKITEQDTYEFYNNDITAIDNMTDLNPYIYGIRLYVNSEIDEISPCFYNINKSKNMSWAESYKNESWTFGYIDQNALEKNDTPLAGLISELRDNNGQLLAILEVSTAMEDLFLDLYEVNNEEYCCIIDENNNIFSSEEQKQLWMLNSKLISDYISDENKLDTSFLTSFNNEDCVISTLSIPSIGCTYVHVARIKTTLDNYYLSQIPYIVFVAIFMIIFIIIIIFMIKNIFKRFNSLTALVSKIEMGSNIVLPEDGDDEISNLAKQINSMVTALETYNKEQINRELLVKNAEIKSLQNQINAHFMYNVLETIKMMAEIREEYQISDAVTSLGDMFRYSMKWTSGLVDLQEEVQYIKNYLDLLNLRFDYEIFLSLNIPKEYKHLKIPKMSLQPIVENSVYHGIENMAEDTSIYLKVYEENDVISIEVSDMGAGMDEKTLEELKRKINSVDPIDEESNHGRALYNVQERIKMHFGSEYGLKIYSQLGAYTKVIVQIPKDKEIKK